MTRRHLGAYSGLVLAGTALAVLGCVERRMTVRSNPPGALVYIDREEVGVTPVSQSFTHYGTRRIKLFKEGYETLDVKEPVNEPVYDFILWELVTETLPIRFRDEREFSYDLKKRETPDPNALVERGTRLRAEAQAQREFPDVTTQGPWQQAEVELDPDDPSWLAPGAERVDTSHPITRGLQPAPPSLKTR